MKAEGLMIGDWVSYKGNPIMVFEIDEPEHNINTEQDGYNAIRCISIDEIQPIPITPEILEKNGFSLLVQNRTYKVFTLREEDKLSIQVDFLGKDSRIIVRIKKYNYESKYYMNCLHNCDIKYVHQLQQAMHLCKINKEIKL